jgi:endonuclease/exonuclease/phosphatase family metal-dependent hydrolase
MRHFLPLLVLWFAFTAQATETQSLRLLSYNIHAGIGVDRVFDLERIAKVIREAEPEIVALQEVDRKTQRSKGIDIAKELATLTGMDFVFAESIRFQGGQYGNAVLTNLPIQSSQTIPIPEKVSVEKRSLLSVVLLWQGKPIQVLSTHLCHREEANRLAAAKLISTMNPKLDSPSFLLGDLNALPESEPLRVLAEAGWQKPSQKPQFTVPVDTPTRQIDYVLFLAEDELAIKVKEVRVLEEKTASDHRPILVVLEW